MKTMKKLSLVVTVLLVLSAVVAGCSSPATPSETGAATEAPTTAPAATQAATDEPTQAPASTEEQIVYIGDMPDEAFEAGWANCGGLLRRVMFRRLILCDENLIPKYPELATEWSISDDELTYTFTLRDDALWHDGEPVTVDDVAWSIEMAIKSASIKNNFAQSFKKIEGAQEFIDGTADSVSGISTDGNVITIKLNEKDAQFLLTMAQWPPLPKHLLEGTDPATLHLAEFWQWPIGNGPYMLTEVEMGSYAVLEPFEDYYGGVAQIPKLMLKAYDDAVVAVEAGELDYYMTSVVDEAVAIEAVDGMKVTPMTINYSRYLMSNLDNGNDAIKDIKVRQALLYAIDRQTIVDDLFQGYAEVLDSKVPSGFWKNEDLEKYPYDPEKAKELLAEAGWDPSTKLVLGYYYSDQTTKDLIATIQYYWKQVGVECETYFLEGNLLELIYQTKDYDFLYAAVSALNIYEMYGIYKTDYQYNVFNYGGPEIDALLTEASQTADVERQKELWYEMQEYENANLQFVPLFSPQVFICERESKFTRPEVFGNEWFDYDQKILEWKLVTQ